MKSGRWLIPDVVSDTGVVKVWEIFWNTHGWMLRNFNISQCSWSIFTESCACVKLVGDIPKSEWIYTSKVLRIEIGFLREKRYLSGVVQLVRDEFQPKEREFYQLLHIVVPRLLLDNFDFIPFPKKLLFRCKFQAFWMSF